MFSKVLFLDDRWEEENWKQSFDKWLPESVEAIYEKFGHKAIQRLTENPEIKLVFLDLHFAGQSEQGEQILNKIKELYPNLRVIILTSINDVELALRLVHAEKKAYYYFYKDSIDPDQVRKIIENAIESHDLQAEAIRKTDKGMIIGESLALKEVLRLAQKASQVDSTVLITGESGTGKELIARTIYLNSRRKEYSFVAVNCGAITETLIESELFGHVKSAFTNASADKRGFFEKANRGTIFLDEVAELKMDMQPKLLRVLEEREFYKVGSATPQKVNVRVIAATNKNLEEQLEKDLFREDLLYRLNIIHINIPPLRERKEDIPLLIKYLLQRLNNESGEAKDISASAIEFLRQCHWSGNARQLRNALERAIVTSKSELLDVEDFNSLISSASSNAMHNNFVDIWTENVISGQANWEDIRKEFGATADSRKRILERIILSLKQNLGHRPSGTELATALEVRRNYLNVILSDLGLRLRDF